MFYVGVDLGQRCDFAALAVADRAVAVYAWMPPMDSRLGVRYLERIPLGTPYTLVARRVEEVVWRPGGGITRWRWTRRVWGFPWWIC
jgi:hypothetical protein